MIKDEYTKTFAWLNYNGFIRVVKGNYLGTYRTGDVDRAMYSATVTLTIEGQDLLYSVAHPIKQFAKKYGPMLIEKGITQFGSGALFGSAVTIGITWLKSFFN